MSDKNDYVVFDHVRKVYHVGEVDIEALADATFSVAKGELAIVVGESGAGKSMTMKAITALLHEGSTKISGRILFRVGEEGRWQDLLEIPYREITPGHFVRCTREEAEDNG